MKVKSLSRVRLFVTLWTVAHPQDSPGKNTGVGCHFLLQAIFPTQGSNPGPPALEADALTFSHQGSHQGKDRTQVQSLSGERGGAFTCGSWCKVPGARNFLLSSCFWLLWDLNSMFWSHLSFLLAVWSSQYQPNHPRSASMLKLEQSCPHLLSLLTSSSTILVTQVHRDFSFQTKLFAVQKHHGISQSVQ